MTKKNSEYFMAYEATKVFAIRNMKTQFTNKNTHILRTDYEICNCTTKSIVHVRGKKSFVRGGLFADCAWPRIAVRFSI